jgi:hypothetical protein
MKLPKYQLRSGQELTSFEFISEGKNGLIVKQIQFTLINKNDIYNLAFGDKNIDTGEVDDVAISNNGDSEKVLATVISAVYAFCENHPNAWIFATGSTKPRTRLYQIGISRFLEEIEEDFELYGRIEENWEEFERGRSYTGFIAKKK